MDHSKERFLLILEGKEQTGKYLTGFSRNFLYDSLRQAFGALETWGNPCFDEAIVAEQKMKIWIEDAVIMDRADNKVVVSKSQLRDHDIENVPGGIYLRLNQDKISNEEFERYTGIQLKDFPVFGRNAGYFQLTTTDKLRAEIPGKKTRRQVTGKRHLKIKGRWS